MKTVSVHPFDSIDRGLLDHVAVGIHGAFGAAGLIGRELVVPEGSFEPARRQHRAGDFLQSLADVAASGGAQSTGGTIRLGVTACDLFVPRLNFVFGVADHQRGVAVISLHRLRPEYYGEPPDLPLFRERTIKEAVHELGHVFGLAHCRNPDCIMHFSHTIDDTDRKGPGFCQVCFRALLAHQAV